MNDANKVDEIYRTDSGVNHAVNRRIREGSGKENGMEPQSRETTFSGHSDDRNYSRKLLEGGRDGASMKNEAGGIVESDKLELQNDTVLINVDLPIIQAILNK